MKVQVKKIIDSKIVKENGRRYFEVIWKNSWEEETFLRSIADDLVEEFLNSSSNRVEGAEVSLNGKDNEAEQNIDNVANDFSASVYNEMDMANSYVSSPELLKHRKGGINAVISRLQKTQQEGLLKHPFPEYDEEEDSANRKVGPQNSMPEKIAIPQNSDKTINTIPLLHGKYSAKDTIDSAKTLEYPPGFKEESLREQLQRKSSELEYKLRETFRTAESMLPNDYLAKHPLSPIEAPVDAKEGLVPNSSSASNYAISSAATQVVQHMTSTANHKSEALSTNLLNLKSNVDNIAKLFQDKLNETSSKSSAGNTSDDETATKHHMRKHQQCSSIFKCIICSDLFYEESKFNQHMFMHEQVNLLKQEPPKLLKPGTFECKFCHILFHDKDKLKLHYSEEHEKEFVHTQPIDQLYQCTLCDQSFVDYTKLLSHHQSHQLSRKEVFILPKKSIQQNLSSGTHDTGENHASRVGPTLIHHHPSPQNRERDSPQSHEQHRSLGASIDSQELRSSSLSDSSGQEETNFVTSKSETLNEVFVERREKVDDNRDSTPTTAEFKYPEETVKMDPSIASDENEETSMVTDLIDKKMYRCNLCDEMFETESDRAKHSLIHVNRSSSLDCHICGKQFRHRTNLSTHLIVHSGVKPHQCHICLRRFTQKVNLQRHMHIHDGSRPFTCRMCSKSFTQKANLQRHILSHTEHTKDELLSALNEIPNESEVNNAINESLAEAMSIIMEQKPLNENTDQKPEFRCDICDKTFAQKVNLQKHMLIHTGSRPFQCYVCGKAFRQRASLQKHYSLHTNGSSSFICQTCKRLFVSRTNLQRHMLVHALQGKNQCYLCDQKFATTDNLERHFSEHIEEATPNISLPQKYFEQSTPGQTFCCATCDIAFDSPIIFSQHLQYHQDGFSPESISTGIVDIVKAYGNSQQPPLRCNECGEVFLSVATLDAHMQNHSDEISVRSINHDMECVESSQISSKVATVAVSSTVCSAKDSIVSADALLISTSLIKSENDSPSTSVSTTPRVSRCPVCKEMFPSKKEMREHYSIAHLEKPDVLLKKAMPDICQSPVNVEPISATMINNTLDSFTLLEECDTMVTNDGGIQVAVISESEERLIKENEEFIKDNILGGSAEYESKGRYERGTYSCKICNRMLTYKYSLEKHMLLHTGSFPYKCHLCSKRFNHKANYDKHLVVHRGDKPYACHICQRPFSQKSNLQRHQLTHTQNRDFICDVCGKRFNHMASLKTHSLIHTGAKPFSCYICTKRFNQKGNLKRHIQTHRTGKRNKINGLGEADPHIDSLIKKEIKSMVTNEGRVIIENEPMTMMKVEQESATMLTPKDTSFYKDMMLKTECDEQATSYGKEIKSEESALPSRKSQRKRYKKNMDDFEFLPDDDEPLPTMIGDSAPEYQKGMDPPSSMAASFPVGYGEGEQILTVLPSDAVYPDMNEIPATSGYKEVLEEKKETYHCGSCSKLFISQASLEAHKRTAHSFIMCDICGRPFSQKANLLKHKLIHANKKPFSCRVCGKAFRQKANLQRHELIHDKDRKTVNCEECNKSFRCTWSLKQHMKNHNTSGGAFGCSICGKTFKGKDRLMHHFSVHNQLGVFSCNLCDMKFPNPTQLSKHSESHGNYSGNGEISATTGGNQLVIDETSNQVENNGETLLIISNSADKQYGILSVEGQSEPMSVV